MKLSVATAALLLGSFVGNAVLPQAYDYGLWIARRSDGLHALPYAYTSQGTGPYNTQVSVWLWNEDPSQGRELKLVGVPKIMYPLIEFAGDNICYIDHMTIVTNNGNVTLSDSGVVQTWNINTGVRSDEFHFQTNLVRWGTSCSLPSGGLFFINFSQQGPPITFDLNYRFPTQPPNPAAVVPPTIWAPTVRWALPAANGEIAASNWQAVYFNGLVWVFLTRDSSQMLALIRFKETTSGMQLFDFHNDYISGFPTNGIQDPMAVHQELPDLSVRVDPWNNRLIAAYQADKGLTNSVNCGRNWARLNIIAVHPDLSRDLLNYTPFYSERVIGLTCFARPNGPYYIQNTNNLGTNCLDGDVFALGNQKLRDLSIVGGISSCADGWIAHSSDQGFVIEKMPLAPTMTITKDGTLTRNQVMAMAAKFQQNPKLMSLPAPENVKVGWDQPSSNDTLQTSQDLNQWTNSYTNAISPVLVPVDGSKYFRVQQ